MLTKLLSVSAVSAILASFARCAAESRAAPLEHRWVYLATNLFVDKNVEEAVAILDRAAKAGYNGIVLTDSKFCRWDDLPERYVQNVRRFRQACRDRKLACIACVCPIGYSNDLLSRDPNLAEGLPVVEARFVAKGRRLLPADDSVCLVNGGFEQAKGDMPTGWGFVDQPGKITFIDTAVKFDGRASLRMEDIGLHDPQNGLGRACQTLAVKPFHYYHVSAAVKTQDFESAGEVQIAVLGKDGAALNFYKPHVEKTQDWKRIDVTFNSLEFSQVNLYLGIWGGRRGKIWWDDVRIEPGGLVNVVRRDGAPLRATSADRRVVYREGRDFQNARDPKLGMIPWPGGFTAWHEPPVDNPAVRQPHPQRPDGLAQLLPHRDHLRGSGDVLHGRAEALRTASLADRAGPQASPAGRLFFAARRNPRAGLGRELPPQRQDARRASGRERRQMRRVGPRRRRRQADLRLVGYVRPDPQRPKDGPVLSGKRRRAMVRFLARAR